MDAPVNSKFERYDSIRTQCAWIVYAALMVLFWIMVFSIPARANQAKFTCPALETAENSLMSLTQGKDGWFFRTGADLKDDFYLSEESRTYLQRLVNALEQRNTKLVFLPVPTRGMLGRDFLAQDMQRQAYFRPAEAEQAFHGLVNQLRSTGMTVLNLLDFLAEENADDNPAFFFKRDTHWTPEGARLASQAVSQALAESPVYQSLDKATYQSKVMSEQQIKHTMAQEIQRLCQSELPPEPYSFYETRQLAEGDSNADLFGSPEGSGSLVLLGTSFSAVTYFNFDGFLAESTGLEVANHAISGGQLFNALASFTASPQFEETDTRLMLWEAPVYSDFNRGSSSAFRQIIPAVYGPCSADTAVTAGQITVNQGEPSGSLTVDPALAVSGNDYYLYLATPNRALAQFTVKIDYADGDFEWFAIDRTERFPNWGRFFIEFSEDIESTVSRIALSGLPELNAELEAHICRAPTLVAERSQSS